MGRSAIITSVAVASVLAAAQFLLAANAPRPPNILFIMADDHASEAIGAYGSWLKDFVRTPTIDRLAHEGIRLTNVCCNNSICSPSRASILTGQYSHKNGVLGLNGTIDADSPWVSAELQKSGYQTAVFGKWHLRSRPRGFDAFKVTKGQGAWFDPTFYTESSGWYPKSKKQPVTGVEKARGYSSDVYTDAALAWLKTRDRQRPFCAMLHFKAPHHSYEYPARHDDLLADVLIPEPPSLHERIDELSPRLKGPHRWHLTRRYAYFDRHVNDTHPPMWPHDKSSEKSRASAAYQHLIHKYIRCVAAVDENIGRVVKHLEAEGSLDDTVVIYTSDQGYWLGQHGLYDKRLILEESLKMPLIVRYPKEIRGNSVSELLCSNVDFAPTLLDFAGTPVPADMQGRSLRPLLRGQQPKDWRSAVWYAYWSAGHPHWGVRTLRHKLIKFPGTSDIEFYDLEKDPNEMNNLAADAAQRQNIAAAEKHLERLKVEVDIDPKEMPMGPNGGGRKAPR
ncbi:MAG: sulfatase [Phycisphaerae bacterium]|nr:sulfatase [Phycisphaerae bacterium]